MSKAMATARWKLTLVTIQGRPQFIRLPVYTDGRTRVPSRFGGLAGLLKLWQLRMTDCIRFWR